MHGREVCSGCFVLLDRASWLYQSVTRPLYLPVYERDKILLRYGAWYDTSCVQQLRKSAEVTIVLVRSDS